MKKYTIIVNNKKKYVKKYFCDVLDIEDSRGPINNYAAITDENVSLTHEISDKFLEQLTEQISEKIFKVLNRKKVKGSFLSIRDRYIVEIENVKYIWITLFWDRTIGEVDLWVKFWSEKETTKSTDESNMIFEIANREESQMCDEIRFRERFKYWVDQINIYFDLFSEKVQKDIEKTHPSNYPDVTINFHFDKIVNGTLKQQVYISLNNYISNFNYNLQNEYRIHDFFLIDNTSNKVISVFIDFGNCEPTILHELLQHLWKSKLGIVDFSFN